MLHSFLTITLYNEVGGNITLVYVVCRIFPILHRLTLVLMDVRKMTPKLAICEGKLEIINDIVT